MMDHLLAQTYGVGHEGVDRLTIRDVLLRGVTGLVALAAAALSLYLAALAAGWTAPVGPFCDGTDLVLHGPWSGWVRAIPISVLAAPLYLTVPIGLVLASPQASARRRRLAWSILLVIATAVVGTGTWLTALLLAIRKVCTCCLAVHALGAIVAYLLAAHAPVGSANLIPPRTVAVLVLIGLLSVGVLAAGQVVHAQRFKTHHLDATPAATLSGDQAAATSITTLKNPPNTSAVQSDAMSLPCPPRPGAQFLAQNVKDPQVKLAPSGLQYRILRQGTGSAPTPQDVVAVHYRCSIVAGEELANTYANEGPTLLKVGDQFEGLRETLLRMRAGAKWNVAIPPHLISEDFPQLGKLPSVDSVLIYDIELLNIVPAVSSAVHPHAVRGDDTP